MAGLAEAIKTNVKNYIRGNVYTAIPATITNVASFEGKLLVDAIPAVSRRFDDGTVMAPPEIASIPVVFPAGGGAILTFPLKVGNSVLLIFSMRSIDEWLASTGGTATPNSSRHHTITDAIAIPSIFPTGDTPGANPDDVELVFGDATIRVSEDTSIDVENSSGYMRLGANGTINLNGVTISPDGTVVVPTKLTSPLIEVDGKELKDHKHSGVQTGSGVSGPNI